MMKFYINFSLIIQMIIHKKSLNILDNKEKDLGDNIKFFYVLYLLSWWKYCIRNLNDWFKEGECGEKRRPFINNIFQSPSRESSFPISYFFV